MIALVVIVGALYVVNATFHEPGTYLLRGRADDGGLFADTEVTVHIRE